MGILTSGILGPVSGKISGVVGGRWKDKSYIRAYAKPANPNTAAQQTQRARFAHCVAFAKPLVGSVFNPYTDPLIKSMSGFNNFIKQNIAEFGGVLDYTALKITEGKLYYGGYDVGSQAVAATNDVVLMTSDATGNLGLASDKIYAIAFNEGSGLFGFAVAETLRSDGGITVPLTMEVDDVVHAWSWAARYSGTVVSQVSDSSYIELTAA